MNFMLSRKRHLRIILGVTLVYIIIQAAVGYFGDTGLSRQLWLEHRNVKESADSDTPAKSGLAPVMKAISDNHFWALRAGLLAAILLSFYYSYKDNEKYLFYKNITLSTVFVLIIAAGIITWTLKIFVGRPRPYTGLSDYASMAFSTRFQSFPSGHTTETFSYLVPFIYFLRRYSAGILLFLLGFIISFFRVFLAYHYISDVIFGIYITIITGYIICVYFDEKWKKVYNLKDL